MPRWWVIVLAVLVALTGCTAGDDRPRTRWSMDHRMAESDDLTVTGRTLSAEYETTGVLVGRDAEGREITCSVTLYARGHGGPEAMGGEPVRTMVRGRRAFRNGPGTEYAYLVW